MEKTSIFISNIELEEQGLEKDLMVEKTLI